MAETNSERTRAAQKGHGRMKLSLAVFGALFLGAIIGANLSYAFGLVRMVLQHCGGM